AIGVPPLDVDAPFKGVLDSLRTLDLPIDLPIEMCSEASTQPSLALPSGSDDQNSGSSLVAQPSSNLLNASLVIRGVASSLETRHLILTNVDNQGLDILTVEQQHWLYQRIAFEVASYCRSEALMLRARVAGALPEGDRPSRIPLSWRFLPPLRHKETTASPIRFFRALMEWMQASPIAMSANLFQEAALPMLGSYQPPEPPEMPQLPGLDGSVQSLKHLLFGSESSPYSFQGGGENGASANGLQQSSEWFDPDHHSSVDGWFSSNQRSSVRRQAEQFLSMPSLPFRRGWISNWDEDFRGSDSLMDSPIEPSTEPSIEPPLTPASTPGQAIQAMDNHPIDEVGRSPDSLSSASAVAAWAASSHQSEGQSSEPEDEWIAPFQKEPGDLSSTWVDTKATVVGYEKHPLEKVLNWIDRMMLWLEDSASKALKWLQTVLKPEDSGQSNTGEDPHDSL
ncbi:MAG: hypothetical protein VKL39_17950, partial [Leptolyngbyaceae bacterium]|nr:hypothetical protein [Leptolyngbyaceae bacterium]